MAALNRHHLLAPSLTCRYSTGDLAIGSTSTKCWLYLPIRRKRLRVTSPSVGVSSPMSSDKNVDLPAQMRRTSHSRRHILTRQSQQLGSRLPQPPTTHGHAPTPLGPTIAMRLDWSIPQDTSLNSHGYLSPYLQSSDSDKAAKASKRECMTARHRETCCCRYEARQVGALTGSPCR